MSKKLFTFTSIFLSLLIFTSFITTDISNSENISNKVLRFHILANSDTDADQTLKLKVRDEILKYSNSLFNDCKTVDQAISVAKKNVNNFNQVALNTIMLNGYDYSVKTVVTKQFFDTRQYENFVLPAGVYDSVKVVIGSGEGHNWWCVMFPSVCLSSSVDEFGAYLTEDEKQLINSNKYIIKFKAIEIYEKLKDKLK